LPLPTGLIPRPGAGLISLKTQNVVREDTNHGGNLNKFTAKSKLPKSEFGEKEF
jgi:hypothetical protein